MKPFYEQSRPVWVGHPSSLDFPPHLHNAVEIVCLLGGTATVICDDERLAMRPGDIFVSFPNQVHGYENSRDFDGYVLISTTSALSGFRAMLEQNQPAQPIIHPTGTQADSISSLVKMMYADRDDAPPPMLRGYALVLFSKMMAMLQLVPRPAATDALQAVLLYIGKHYREPITRGGGRPGGGLQRESYLPSVHG